MPRPPKPLKQPPDLAAFLRLCGVEKFDENLGLYFLCPHCSGRQPTDKPLQEITPQSNTLRVHLNLANEIVIHCGNCGRIGTALDWFRQSKMRPLDWDGVKKALEDRRVFGENPVPEEWLERGKFWERFSELFEKAKARYRSWQHQPSACPVNPFGEVGIVESRELRRQLPEISPGGENRKVRYYLELRRSTSGLPLQISLRATRSLYDEIRHLWLQPKEPFLVLTPEGSLHRNWRKGAVFCTDPLVAQRLEFLIGNLSGPKLPPLIQVVQASGPCLDELPFHRILYVYGENESPDFGLALAQGGTRVHVAPVDQVGDTISDVVDVFALGKEVITLTAETIVDKAGAQESIIPYLEAITSRPWISSAIRDRLGLAVASLAGKPLDHLVAKSEIDTQLLSLRNHRATYVCRNGIFLKAMDRERREFVPASNFRLRIDRSYLDSEGDLTHQVVLQLSQESARFEIADRDFERGAKLIEAATKAAVTSGHAVYPRLHDVEDIRQLPTIVKATQSRAPLCIPAPAELGFTTGRFHGPNFSVSAKGFQCRETFEDSQGRPAGWMLPEYSRGQGSEHLTLKANELAAWIDSLEEIEQTTVGAVLHAALAWLQRGCRGLSSHLLLPSSEHLDLLGRGKFANKITKHIHALIKSLKMEIFIG